MAKEKNSKRYLKAENEPILGESVDWPAGSKWPTPNNLIRLIDSNQLVDNQYSIIGTLN